LIDVQNAVFVQATSIAGSEIVGTYTLASQTTSGFIEVNGQITPWVVPGAVDTFLLGVNSKGDLIGVYDNDPDSRITFGFVDRSGVLTTIPIAANQVTPLKVNNQGVVIGISTSTTSHSSFMYDKSGMVTFITHGSDTVNVHDINDNGVVVGDLSSDFGLTQHGFLYSKGAFSIVDIPNALSTSITAINNNGDVAGQYEDGFGTLHGFFLDHTGTITQIGVDQPTALNNNDVVVGTANIGGIHTAAAWSNGTTFTLAPSGARGSVATGVSSNNTVIGSFFDAGGIEHAFIATPV
jgi:hypothetical protein